MIFVSSFVMFITFIALKLSVLPSMPWTIVGLSWFILPLSLVSIQILVESLMEMIEEAKDE